MDLMNVELKSAALEAVTEQTDDGYARNGAVARPGDEGLGRAVRAWATKAGERPLLAGLGRSALAIILHADRERANEKYVEFDVTLPSSVRCSVSASGDPALRVVTLLALRPSGDSTMVDVVSVPVAGGESETDAATWLHGTASADLMAEARTSTRAMNDVFRSCYPVAPTSDDLADLGGIFSRALEDAGLL